MQFIDLAAQQRRIREKIESNISAILDHGQYIMGPEVKLLEDRLANYVGSKHALACASGTDALLLALMAFEVGPGHAIFTSPFTFIATAEVISLLGATPVFVDIDSDTFNIDPVGLESAIQAVKKNDIFRSNLCAAFFIVDLSQIFTGLLHPFGCTISVGPVFHGQFSDNGFHPIGNFFTL